MLSIVKSNPNLHGYALLVSTYSALLFFLGAALSGLILTNMFGEFPTRAIQWGSGSKRSWVWVMRHCGYSIFIIRACLHQIPRSGLPDRGHHIPNCAGAHVRLAGRVDLCQRHTLNRHDARGTIPGPPLTTSFTRLTGRLQEL